MTMTLNTDKTISLVETLLDDVNDRFKVDSIESGRSVYTQWEYEIGRKYIKVWSYLSDDGDKMRGRSCLMFIDKNDGSVYKSASYKAPAKGVRFSLKGLVENPTICDPYGSFLYVR